MMKHAYLIIAHNEPLILKTLISLIDDERNDIFLLIDSRSNLIPQNIKPRYSSLYYCNRIPIYWGDYSQYRQKYYYLKQLLSMVLIHIITYYLECAYLLRAKIISITFLTRIMGKNL